MTGATTTVSAVTGVECGVVVCDAVADEAGVAVLLLLVFALVFLL